MIQNLELLTANNMKMGFDARSQNMRLIKFIRKILIHGGVLLGVRAIARNTYCFCSVFFSFSSPSSSSSPDRLSTKKHILANVART